MISRQGPPAARREIGRKSRGGCPRSSSAFPGPWKSSMFWRGALMSPVWKSCARLWNLLARSCARHASCCWPAHRSRRLTDPGRSHHTGYSLSDEGLAPVAHPMMPFIRADIGCREESGPTSERRTGVTPRSARATPGPDSPLSTALPQEPRLLRGGEGSPHLRHFHSGGGQCVHPCMHAPPQVARSLEACWSM